MNVRFILYQYYIYNITESSELKAYMDRRIRTSKLKQGVFVGNAKIMMADGFDESRKYGEEENYGNCNNLAIEFSSYILAKNKNKKVNFHPILSFQIFRPSNPKQSLAVYTYKLVTRGLTYTRASLLNCIFRLSSAMKFLEFLNFFLFCLYLIFFRLSFLCLTQPSCILSLQANTYVYEDQESTHLPKVIE